MLNNSVKQLTIPIPRPNSSISQGNRANPVAQTIPISVRWTEADRKFIDQQANMIGLSFSEFVRWTAFYCALEINKLTYQSEFNRVHKKPQTRETDLDGYE
jgi:hypothetical protein